LSAGLGSVPTCRAAAPVHDVFVQPFADMLHFVSNPNLSIIILVAA
jgi:hypothetical protein